MGPPDITIAIDQIDQRDETGELNKPKELDD